MKKKISALLLSLALCAGLLAGCGTGETAVTVLNLEITVIFIIHGL